MAERYRGRSVNLDRRVGETDREFENRVLANLQEQSDMYWLQMESMFDDIDQALREAKEAGGAHPMLEACGHFVIMEVARRRAVRAVENERLMGRPGEDE
jgi:hypothetical protein